MTDRKPQTLRGWAYPLAVSIAYLMFDLVGLVMVVPDYGTGDDSVGRTGHILGGIILLIFVPPLLRLPFLRVVLNDDGIVIHNPARNRRYTWDQIERCEVGKIQSNVVTLVAPIVTVAGAEDRLGVRFLESFVFRAPERTRAGKQAAEIESCRLAAAA